MDGVSTEVYKNAAAVKSKNPDLKVLIALGGWSFSDPGNWQAIFPTMVSTPANRATFINNLLGWLSEYGYDGVDFDWEYPAADDRGGSDVDTDNFTALLKELRAAFDANSREYIITFTAPSSYWYLQHFDISNMVEYADWINLMSYDLHGIWDSDNPIGSQVLAHTNLTEIDLALDLFWRNDIAPSKIVLGLGFYGRSFKLSDTSCWKPGCSFSGPGSEGSCTQTPGILSYREISSIITKTGAKPYFDEDAAVKYLVYNGNSWISFDDAETFGLKIKYANSMGLGGLMVWAIDQDDVDLTALRSIADSSLASNDRSPFTLVDLHYLWSTPDYPTDDSDPRYGLVNFGGEANLGGTDPSKTGFGFFIVAGDSYAVSTLKRRDGEPEPFTFLDCPEDVMGQPDTHTHKARVICLSDDIEGCFRLMERGVEGTIVKMPDNCAPGTFARAISLGASGDQTIPGHLQGRSTSEVLDFAFDYNFALVRKDTEQTSIRLDYSSIPGYWDDLVDSSGVETGDEERRKKRFYSIDELNWRDKFGQLSLDEHQSVNVEWDLTESIYWGSATGCEVDGTQFSEGFGAYVKGKVSAEFQYGITILAVVTDGKLSIKQADGVLFANGNSDLSFTVGGVGKVDIGQANNGNPSWYEGKKQPLGGHTIYASGMKGWATYKPYIQVDYMMATADGKGFANSEITFNGLLNARVNTPIGPIQGIYPTLSNSDFSIGAEIPNPQISISSENILYGTGTAGDTSKIILACYFDLGLDATFGVEQENDLYSWEGPDMKLRFESNVEFDIDDTGDDGICVDYAFSTLERARIESSGALAGTIHWPEEPQAYKAYSSLLKPDAGLCYPKIVLKRSLPTRRDDPENTNKDQVSTVNTNSLISLPADHALIERGSSFPGWGYAAGNLVTAALIFKGSSFNDGPGVFDNYDQLVKCKDCFSCTRLDDLDEGSCCGCISMDWQYEYSDKPSCDAFDCNPDDGEWPGLGGYSLRSIDDEDAFGVSDVTSSPEASYHTHQKRRNGVATRTPKTIDFCGAKFKSRSNNRYPSFPADSSFQWAGIENGRWDAIPRYFGNESAICSDWSVTFLDNPDQEMVNLQLVRRKYQTEHVFEGQLISDFFAQWLDKGAIVNQNPAPSAPTAKLACTQINSLVIDELRWGLTSNQPFVRYIMEELGSITHLDRLTIYLARPNQAKGAIFSGYVPTAVDKFVNFDPEAQLLAVKEMGMMFEYMRMDVVWNAFCATYEAIYDKMGEFDTWYSTQPLQVAISLQAEWKEYIRVTLDSIVINSHERLATYINQRRIGSRLEPHWAAVRLTGYNKLKFDRVCNNMDPTTVDL